MKSNNPQPRSAILLPTLGCNFHCKMCFHWQNMEENIERPSVKQWKDFASSFQEIIENTPTRDAFSVIFGGGEPLIFLKDVIEIIKHCADSGYRTSLATNGYMLNSEVVKQLIDSGLNNIGLSLDSLEETTHDQLRGVDGSYRKVMEGIDDFKKLNSNVRIAINTTIMAQNLDNIVKIADYVRKEDSISSVLFQAIVHPFHVQTLENWQETREYGFLWPQDLNNLYDIIDQLIELKKTGDFSAKIDNSISQLKAFKDYFKNPGKFIKTLKCNAADSGFFTIGPDGNVNLCPYMESIGSIKNRCLRDIWNSDKAVKIREDMSTCKRNCHHLINCWFEEEAHE